MEGTEAARVFRSLHRSRLHDGWYLSFLVTGGDLEVEAGTEAVVSSGVTSVVGGKGLPVSPDAGSRCCGDHLRGKP